MPAYYRRGNHGYSFCDRSYKCGYSSEISSELHTLASSKKLSAPIEEGNCNRK